MRHLSLLVLGGTGFLGSHVVESAVARGHEVVIADRGRTAPAAFPELERIRGERSEALAQLGHRSFDAAVDLSGFDSASVTAAARALRENVERYVFVSSISAYADLTRPGVKEEDELAVSRDDYGGLKAQAELALDNEWPRPSLVVRPGVLAGPGDPTGRFAYWPLRFARGGEVVAPGPPDRPIQYADARDLGSWLVGAVERGLDGTFNAVTPPIAAAAFLDACRRAAASDATVVWIDPDELERAGVEPWTDLPLWAGSDWAGLMRVDGTRALAAGLTFRPVEDTARDTLRWALANPDAFAARGLAPDAEASLLARVGGGG